MDDVKLYPSEQHARQVLASAFRFAVAQANPEWEAVVAEWSRGLVKPEADQAAAAATGATADEDMSEEDTSAENEDTSDVAVGGSEALEVLEQIGAIDGHVPSYTTLA